MQKVIRLKLLKDPGAEGGFCMSVGSIVEFHNGGFKTVGVNKNYYPVFGPYSMLERIAEQLVNGTAADSAKELFEVADVTNTVFPTQLHDIMDEAGGQLICTVGHSGLMSLLKSRLITSFRHSAEEEVFRISNMLHVDEVREHAIADDIVADVRTGHDNQAKDLAESNRYMFSMEPTSYLNIRILRCDEEIEQVTNTTADQKVIAGLNARKEAYQEILDLMMNPIKA